MALLPRLGSPAPAPPPTSAPQRPIYVPTCVLSKRVNDLPRARADHVMRLGLDSRSLYFEAFVPAA